MPVKVEVLRSLNQWVEVNSLGPEPYEIRSDISYARTRYIIGQDEDGTGGIQFTLSPTGNLAKKLSSDLGKPVYDIEAKPLESGHSVFIEGILPGNTKTEMLRITQK